MKKVVKIVLLVLTLCMTFVVSVYADEWVTEGGHTKYKVGDGFATSTWKLIKGADDYYNYYFDENGYMVTGVWKIDGEYYSFNTDGSSNSKGKVVIDNKEYETVNKGKIETFPKNKYDQESFAGEWLQEGDNWKFMVNGQPVKKAFRLINSGKDTNCYYFDDNGYMVKGDIYKIDGNYHVFNNSGIAMSYTKYKIYDDECETEAKGQVTYVPSGFTLDEYHADMKKEEEAKKESESKAQVEASIAKENEDKLKEANKAAMESKAKEDAAKAIVKEEEQKKAAAELEAKKLTLAGKTYDKITVDNDAGGQIKLTYPVPRFAGATADAVNNAVNGKLKNIITVTLEDSLSESKSKVSKKLNDVSMNQDINNHLVTLYFTGDFSLRVYIDTNSLEVWCD